MRVNSSEGPFEERYASPVLQAALVRGTRLWKLALAAILLTIVLAVAASVLNHLQQEGAPMQIEPKSFMA